MGKQRSVYVTDQNWERLGTISLWRGISRTRIIEMLIEDHIESYTPADKRAMTLYQKQRAKMNARLYAREREKREAQDDLSN